MPPPTPAWQIVTQPRRFPERTARSKRCQRPKRLRGSVGAGRFTSRSPSLACSCQTLLSLGLGRRGKGVRACDWLNPSLAEGHHLHAYILETRNHMEEALQEDRLTVELDPFARPWAYGYALIRARRFDEALKELSQRSEARPDAGLLHSFLSNAHFHQGDYARAMDELRKVLTIEGNDWTPSAVDKAYRNGGFQAVNLEFLMRLKRKATKEYVSPFTLAEAASRAGRKEEAIQHLQQAFQQRDPMLIHLQHEPDLDPLHSDPRYCAILKKMAMPPFQ